MTSGHAQRESHRLGKPQVGEQLARGGIEEADRKRRVEDDDRIGHGGEEGFHPWIGRAMAARTQDAAGLDRLPRHEEGADKHDQKADHGVPSRRAIEDGERGQSHRSGQQCPAQFQNPGHNGAIDSHFATFVMRDAVRQAPLLPIGTLSG